MTRGTKRASTLPDLDDDVAFAAKLRPLQSVLPKTTPNSHYPVLRITG